MLANLAVTPARLDLDICLSLSTIFDLVNWSIDLDPRSYPQAQQLSEALHPDLITRIIVRSTCWFWSFCVRAREAGGMVYIEWMHGGGRRA